MVLNSWDLVYLTCRIGLVRCGEAALARLLESLAALYNGDQDECWIAYPSQEIPSFVACGYECCRGKVTGDLWINPWFEPFQFEQEVRDVLAGRIDALPWSTVELFHRAKASQPDSAKWPIRLAKLYWEQTQGAGGEQRTALAAAALAEFGCVLSLNLEDGSFLLPAAEAAFEAGAYATAAALADRVLVYHWRDVARGRQDNAAGRAICVAHVILGRIAWRAGDDLGARAHFLHASKAPFTLQAGGNDPVAGLADEIAGLA